MSSAARDPLAADELPELSCAQLMVGEAPPVPAPGPERDALAAGGAQRIDRAVALMESVINAYGERLESVVGARLRSPKTRKGTRWWSQSKALAVGVPPTHVVRTSGPAPRETLTNPIHDRVTPGFFRGVDASSAHISPTRGAVELKSIDASYVLPERITGELATAVRPVALRIVADASASVAKSLGRPNTGLAAFDWRALESAVDSVVGRLADVNERHARDIRAAILAADSTDETLDAALERVMEATRRGGRWLLLAGRTLATALAGDAALAAAKAMGVTHTQWLCVAADTKIWAPGSVNVARRWSEDGLLRLTTSEGDPGGLAVTPDHPLLTQRGWVAACDLHVGDHLIRSTLIERDTGSDPHVEHQPAEIAEVFAAAEQVHPAQRVMRPLLDLDSHGRRRYVDVVAVDGQVRDKLETPFREPRAQGLLTVTDLAWPGLLASRYTSGELIGPNASDVERGEELSAARGGLGRLSGHPHASSGRVATPGQPVVLDDAAQHGVVGIESSSQRTGRFTVAISRDDGRFIECSGVPSGVDCRAELGLSFGTSGVATSGVAARQEFITTTQATADGLGTDIGDGGGDFGGSLARSVATDEIVRIEFDPTPCHVYDLQTVTGWFVANGYIIHNSRRDSRVRHTHVTADGQERSVTSKFQVGAFRLRFPADPEVLPTGAAEVYGCRCSLLFARPDPTRDKAAMLAGRGTADAARRLLDDSTRPHGPVVLSTPELGAGMSIPAVPLRSDTVGYRVLDSEPPVTPGQRISWPGELALALAPPAVTAGVVVLAVALPVGMAVGVAAGAMVLPASATLSVASVVAGQIVATPVTVP